MLACFISGALLAPAQASATPPSKGGGGTVQDAVGDPIGDQQGGDLDLLVVNAFTNGDSLTVELIGDPAAIAAVKRGILWGLLLLVPALPMTGASGFRLAGGARSGPIGAKRRRMPIIALNGLLVLVPCAVALDHLAQAGRFGTPFLTLQAIELAAGAVNIALMGLNARDGRRLVRGD
ncbi:MAG: hypothetical protein GVY28_09655 [Alphaproteobacteria bacterium]|nr:hypothetical protein [Alphaproteobacteria bacterium]